MSGFDFGDNLKNVHKNVHIESGKLTNMHKLSVDNDGNLKYADGKCPGKWLSYHVKKLRYCAFKKGGTGASYDASRLAKMLMRSGDLNSIETINKSWKSLSPDNVKAGVEILEVLDTNLRKSRRSGGDFRSTIRESVSEHLASAITAAITAQAETAGKFPEEAVGGDSLNDEQKSFVRSIDRAVDKLAANPDNFHTEVDKMFLGERTAGTTANHEILQKALALCADFSNADDSKKKTIKQLQTKLQTAARTHTLENLPSPPKPEHYLQAALNLTGKASENAGTVAGPESGKSFRIPSDVKADIDRGINQIIIKENGPEKMLSEFLSDDQKKDANGHGTRYEARMKQAESEWESDKNPKQTKNNFLQKAKEKLAEEGINEENPGPWVPSKEGKDKEKLVSIVFEVLTEQLGSETLAHHALVMACQHGTEAIGSTVEKLQHLETYKIVDNGVQQRRENWATQAKKFEPTAPNYHFPNEEADRTYRIVKEGDSVSIEITQKVEYLGTSDLDPDFFFQLQISQPLNNPDAKGTISMIPLSADSGDVE